MKTPKLWAHLALHELFSHLELVERLVDGTKQGFSSSPGVVAMLSLWISSPIFPRYLLLPSVSGKPAHSTGLHAAIICPPPQILHWLAISSICSSVPLGEGATGVTSHKDSSKPCRPPSKFPPKQCTTQSCWNLHVLYEFFLSAGI